MLAMSMSSWLSEDPTVYFNRRPVTILVRIFLTFIFFFFNDTATTEIYTLSLHDALPILITTGGLGPTRDDMTKAVVADLFGKRLVLDERLLASLEARFKKLGRPMPALNRTQAEVPEGATVLPNPRGTAPGLWVEDARGRGVVLLPGVPREMRGLLIEEVLPRLVARHAG